MNELVNNVSQSTFDRDVIRAEKTVLVDFYADWCAPCKAVAPIVNELAGEYVDSLDVRKVDVDQNQELAQLFGIRSIPTLIFFKNGQPRETITGLVPKAQLAEVVERLSG